jgi:hypothetical protein
MAQERKLRAVTSNPVVMVILASQGFTLEINVHRRGLDYAELPSEPIGPCSALAWSSSDRTVLAAPGSLCRSGIYYLIHIGLRTLSPRAAILNVFARALS